MSDISSIAIRKKANILMCGDSNYFQHIAVCLVSLAQSNANIDLYVVILVTKPSEQSNVKLKASLQQFSNLVVDIHEFSYEKISKLPLKNSYPPEIYARFWVADYFNSDVERVLYLDGDMVVVGSVDYLLNLELKTNILAAVQIPGSKRASILGIDEKYGYFNSGVMVINLKKWREIDALTLLLNASEVIRDKLNDPDQDVLNYCFYDQCIHLDYIWNAITPFYKEINSLPLNKDEIERVRQSVKIVHFNGSSKPWQYLCVHPYAKEYLRCLKRTAWNDFKPADYNPLNVLKKIVLKLFGEKKSQLISKIYRVTIKANK